MNTKFQVNIFATLKAISAASELTNLKIAHHSERVAYIALQIADQLELDEMKRHTLIKSCLLHDIGVSSNREKLSIIDLNSDSSIVAPHCIQGASLLKQTKLLASLSPIILRHHDPWAGSSIVNAQNSPDLLSQIICLADRIENLIIKEKYILWQKKNLLNHVKKQSGSILNPNLVYAFIKVAEKDSFWLDLQSGYYKSSLEDIFQEGHQLLNFNELEDIAGLFAKIIDKQSSFTAFHSQGVANYAMKIGNKLGLSETYQKKLRIAGLLHDLGKLALPDELLNFTGKFNEEQKLMMNQHTYYTYHLLDSMGPGLKNIRNWAAFHHERLDGTGYPFGMNASQLDIGCRIIAIADVTQALTEARPYRPQLPIPKVEEILLELVEENALDSELVKIVISIL